MSSSAASALKVLRLIVFYAALIGLWQLVYEMEIWSPYLFPSPQEVWDSLWKNIQDGDIPEGLKVSLQRLAVGYVIAFGIGMGVGLVMGSVRWVDETVGTLVLGLQSLPSITWLPLAVLWFGLSEEAIIFVVIMGSVAAIAISARAGIQSVPPLLRRAAQTFGANRWQMYRYVMMPAMLPSLVQGLKLGWSFSWRSLMAGELIFVSLGLGHILSLGRNLNDMSLVVAVMLVIVAVGMFVDVIIFGRLEKWVNERWGFALHA
jgi:NitT/TauT family transport system permease protein